MNDVSFFWIAFGSYLAATFVLIAAAFRRSRGTEAQPTRGADTPRPQSDAPPTGLARAGRGLVWLGLAAQTVSIVWRAFVIGSEAPQRFFERLGAAFAAGAAGPIACYALLAAVAAAAVAIGVAFRRSRHIWLPAAAVAVVLELILLDFLDFTRLPIEKVYEYLSFASWCSAIALLAASPWLRLVAMDAALALAASLLTVFAAIQPKSVELQLVPALQSYWLFIHVSLTAAAYAVFGIAFVVGAMLLVRAYDPALVQPGTRRRFMAVGIIVKGVALAATLALVLGGLALPFREVAYAPHELVDAAGVPVGGAYRASLPRVGLIQVVRYGAAFIGLYGTLAFVLFWSVWPLARRRDDQSGFGSFVFIASALAVFAACLILGGITRGQEHRIARLHDERSELSRLAGELGAPEGKAITRQGFDADIEHWSALSLQARGVLAKARWLPLSLERQAELATDPVFVSLRDLFARSGAEWKPVIRYNDIKQIGRELGKRADNTRALGRRLSFPADRAQLERVGHAIVREYEAREAAALLPRRAAGQIATFVGLAIIIALPLGWALYFALPRLRDLLPEAPRLDRISYGAILIAYPVFTFGALFAGAIWAHFAWGNWWSWDPKEVGSLIAWVLYTIYLHQRYREGLSPRAAALAAILGFIACSLSLAGNAFLGGLHAYS